MRMDELGKVDPEIVLAATKLVLDSMPGSESVVTVMRLPAGAIDTLTEALCSRFLQLLCQLRGQPPCQIFQDRELFKYILMALQTSIVVAFTIGHSCGEATRDTGKTVH